MANYIFRTPVVYEGPIGKHRLFYFFQQPRGITIVRSGSTYSQVRYQMEQDLINNYDQYWLGGYNHTVDEATKAALIAGGIDVTEENFTAI